MPDGLLDLRHFGAAEIAPHRRGQVPQSVQQPTQCLHTHP
ncbi:hypothetical protein SFR_7035 (plasmid) [Streptomyces sp. FR-008]|nr:hypothetical protein SFR_7035 [Streptomyces sp. FR-008]